MACGVVLISSALGGEQAAWTAAACAVAVGWLGERLSPAHWLAFGLAVAGIALIAWPTRAGKAAPD